MEGARENNLGVRGRGGQVVVDLGGVRHGVQLLADRRQRARDQVRRALLAKPEHHGGAHVKGVALPVKMPRAAARDDVPAHSHGWSAACMLKPVLAHTNITLAGPSSWAFQLSLGQGMHAAQSCQGCMALRQLHSKRMSTRGWKPADRWRTLPVLAA